MKSEEARRQKEKAKKAQQAAAKKNAPASHGGGSSDQVSDTPASSSGFIKPAAGRFSSGFGGRSGGHHHYGLDIAAKAPFLSLQQHLEQSRTQATRQATGMLYLLHTTSMDRRIKRYTLIFQQEVCQQGRESSKDNSLGIWETLVNQMASIFILNFIKDYGMAQNQMQSIQRNISANKKPIT